MAKRNQHIASLEKLLTHLKNVKLEYLKAGDHANASEDKRFFHQQALLRNRFFQEVLNELQILGMSYDELVISKLKFDQLLISSIETYNATAFEKCLEGDKILLKIYNSLIDHEFSNSKFSNHISTIEIAIEKNQVLSDYSNHNNQIKSNF